MNDKTRRRRDLYKSDFKSEPVEISADWRSTQDPLWLMDNLHLCPVTEVTWESINVETDRRMLAGPLSVLCPVSWNQEDIKAVWFLDSFWWQSLSWSAYLTDFAFGLWVASAEKIIPDFLSVMTDWMWCTQICQLKLILVAEYCDPLHLMQLFPASGLTSNQSSQPIQLANSCRRGK